jgi:23S rRNA G2445 N2-methylase RlmL
MTFPGGELTNAVMARRKTGHTWMRREGRLLIPTPPGQAAQWHPGRMPKTGATRMFATTVPGVASIASRELARRAGITVHDAGFDGRSDLLLFEASRDARRDVLDLGLTEDVFVEVGRTFRADGDRPGWISGRIWRPERVQRALSVWAEQRGPLTASITFRVVVRVLQERSFLRTELRRSLKETIHKDRPRWRDGDPAGLEVWLSEYAPGRLVAGLRLSGAQMRQHDGRPAERAGALRPTVANAIVRLAGAACGVLVDPCCGSGTILREALAAGWTAASGFDIDPQAVRAARHNVPDAEIRQGDARTLDLPDGSAGACVSNLPFGRQYTLPGDAAGWLAAVLGTMARITRPGGRVVLLAPEIPRSAVPERLRPRERFPIRLLGVRTAIWVYDRT